MIDSAFNISIYYLAIWSFIERYHSLKRPLFPLLLVQNFFDKIYPPLISISLICGVMVSVPISNAVYRWFELLLGQTKDYEIIICCVYAKHTALRSKSKDIFVKTQLSVWA